MEEIIKFINNPIAESTDSIKIDDDSEKFYAHYLQKYYKEGPKLQKSDLKKLPNIESGQIWICKLEYFDYQDHIIIGKIPYYVYIESGPYELSEDFAYIRALPISGFVEFKADDDIIITDESIIGFPFLIETWNSQPISISVLDQYIASIKNLELNSNSSVNLNEFQIEFRESEIKQTSYIRQSIIAYMEYMENKMVVNISMSGKIIPISNRGYYEGYKIASRHEETIKTIICAEPENLYESKQQTSEKDNVFQWDIIIGDKKVKIELHKIPGSYHLFINYWGKCLLIGVEGKEIKGQKVDMFQLFDLLKKGIYTIILKDDGIDLRLQID